MVEAEESWEPTLNEEHDAYRWVSPENARTILHWPEARTIVQSIGY